MNTIFLRTASFPAFVNDMALAGLNLSGWDASMILETETVVLQWIGSIPEPLAPELSLANTLALEQGLPLPHELQYKPGLHANLLLKSGVLNFSAFAQTEQVFPDDPYCTFLL